MTDNKPDPVVEVNDLSRSFPDQRAVQSISFRVSQNQIFGLVGPDGAGKTTTLRMLAGILDPTAGSATVSGHSITENPEAIKTSIGYMSQRFGLYGDLSVEENLNFYGDLFGLSPADRESRISNLLERTDMDPFRDRPAGDLSGGMKQKLYLSCTLLHRPNLLILDEPTNGVDPISRREFWKILYELVQDGLSVVVTTAYLDEAERCGRVALMDHGQILAKGAPSELKGRIGSDVLEIRTPAARTVLKKLQEEKPHSNIILYGDRLHYFTTDPESDRSTLAAWFRETSFELSGLDRIDPTLEDVLLQELDRGEAEHGEPFDE